MRTHFVSCLELCLDFIALADRGVPAVDTTFLNVVVRNSDRPFPDFNPGNMDPSTGMSIVGEIAIAYVEEPDDSVLKPNIERNFEFFQSAALAMGRSNFKTWWQGPRVSLTNSSAANLTESANNLVLAANITLPANSTFSRLNSTSLCAGAGNGITPGCSGQDNDRLTTS